MKILIFILAFLNWLSVSAQFVDDFTDGDFSSTPQWQGNITNFIVNSSSQLQTNSLIASTSFLSTLHGLTTIDNSEWRFWIKMAFSPSANNFSKVYLTASNSDLSSNPDGFFLKFGESGSTDRVRLFKQENGIATEICSGNSGEIATSFEIGVRVLRDDSGNWELYVDPTGGENFSIFSTGYDPSALIGTSSGVVCKYTLSNANKFYFDNFFVGNIVVDSLPPEMVSASIVNNFQIDVFFNEAVEITSSQNISVYVLDPYIEISNIAIDILNPKQVHISFNSPFINGQTYSISSNNVSDTIGNVSGNQILNFTYLISETPIAGDVIINEFMADPSPIIGLPEVEYIEIYNKSNKYFNLEGWKIGDASSEGTIQETWLFPGDYKILCSNSALLLYPDGIGVTSFPSLNNSGDDIVLKNLHGEIVDKLFYTDDWYSDDLKKNGGFSLERINPEAICSNKSNWKASNSPNGGTPMAENSVFDSIPDITPPFIVDIVEESPNIMEIYFNEEMDSLSLYNSLIEITPCLLIQSRNITANEPTIFKLELDQKLLGSTEYSIVLNNISDCSLNSIDLKGKFEFPEHPVIGDIIINEILFNPLSGGNDFIEIFNSSTKLIDLNNWSFANYDDDTISNLKVLSAHTYLEPGEYMVITEDSLFIKQNYPFTVSGRFIQNDLPNYNNDSSSVYLLFKDEIMDKVSYSEDWHFRLIEDTKGKSLERIDSKGLSNSLTNWHTASESVSFATPGRINSQNSHNESIGKFEFTSKTISPDNDGFEDVLQVTYQMNKPGMVGTFTIYNDQGRLIRTILKNELLATEGSFTWDGISDDDVKTVIGTYVGVFEAFEINGGEVFNKTKAFVVAGKL